MRALHGDDVARELRVGLAARQSDGNEAAVDQVELAVDVRVRVGDLAGELGELRDDARGRPAVREPDEAAEVAGAHGVGREQRVRHDEVLTPARLDREEEEGSVFPVVELLAALAEQRQVDGAAQRERRLVRAQVVLGAEHADAPGLRVGRGVARVPEGLPVELVRAGLGREVDDAAAAHAVLGGVGGGLHGELLHRLRREADDLARDADAGVARAVGEDGGAARSAAVQAQVVAGGGRAGSDRGVFAAGVARDVRGRHGEVEHAAVEERNVL